MKLLWFAGTSLVHLNVGKIVKKKLMTVPKRPGWRFSKSLLRCRLASIRYLHVIYGSMETLSNFSISLSTYDIKYGSCVVLESNIWLSTKKLCISLLLGLDIIGNIISDWARDLALRTTNYWHFWLLKSLTPFPAYTSALYKLVSFSSRLAPICNLLYWTKRTVSGTGWL